MKKNISLILLFVSTLTACGDDAEIQSSENSSTPDQPAKATDPKDDSSGNQQLETTPKNSLAQEQNSNVAAD